MNPDKQKKQRTVRVEINGDYCKGCNICIEFCPTNVFEESKTLNRKGYYLPVVAREEDCTGCRICDLLCPEMALIITIDGGSTEADSDTKADDNNK